MSGEPEQQQMALEPEPATLWTSTPMLTLYGTTITATAVIIAAWLQHRKQRHGSEPARRTSVPR